MKEFLKFNGFDLYQSGDKPEKLAEKVINRVLHREITIEDLPVDPFYLLKKSGVVYTFLNFDKYEGFYLLNTEYDGPKTKTMVGINKNRPIARQRFTAAHELCHHIKDEKTYYCISGAKDEVEVFADQFASSLLMPSSLIISMIQNKNITKDMSEVNYLKKILEISVLFGVSFQAAFYKVNNYVQKIKRADIQKTLRNFKPNAKKKELGLDNEYELYAQVVRSYQFVRWAPTKKIQNDYQRLLISNDHRMENGNLEESEINELIAEIRFKGIDEVKKEREEQQKALSNDDLEILGQFEMYNFVFERYSNSSIFEIFRLHQNFYAFVPFKEVGGTYRTAPARILGKPVKTAEPTEISAIMTKILNDFDDKKKQGFFNDNYEIIKYLVTMHHKITVIHPFQDGNGRTSRAFFNKALLLFNIPLFYIHVDSRDQYHRSLEECDNNGDYRNLILFFINNIIDVYSWSIDVSNDTAISSSSN